MSTQEISLDEFDAERTRIGLQIRKLRLAAGYTQNGLAEVSGVGRVTLARIEVGQQDPTVSTLLRIAAGLGVRPGSILDGDESSTEAL